MPCFRELFRPSSQTIHSELSFQIAIPVTYEATAPTTRIHQNFLHPRDIEPNDTFFAEPMCLLEIDFVNPFAPFCERGAVNNYKLEAVFDKFLESCRGSFSFELKIIVRFFITEKERERERERERVTDYLK